MGTIAEITIGRPDWLWVGVGIAVLAVVFQLWRYGGASPMPVASRLAAGTLRVGGILLLCACLLDVQWTVRRAKDGANVFAVLADRGRGMQVRDGDGGRMRAELLANVLRKDGAAAEGDSWQATLESTFEVRRYAFGDRLENVDDYEALEFDGGRSDLAAALRVLARRYRNRPIAGVLLLSDGNATDLRNVEELGEEFFESEISIFPVVVGTETALKDLAIADARVSQMVFEDAPVNIEVDVRASKFAGKTIELRLRDEEGAEVEKQSHKVLAEEETHCFRVRVRPEKTGVLFYELEFGEKGTGTGEESRPIGSEETTAENNRRLVMVERPQGPYRVLYVSGRPNWDCISTCAAR